MENLEKKISVPLALGIMFLPFIFGWVLLSKGYSNLVRIMGFGYILMFAFVFFSTPGTQPSGENKNQTSQTVAKVVEQKASPPKDCSIYRNMLADDVLSAIGKPDANEPIGRNRNGLIMEWRYSDCVLTLNRFELNGVEAFRVSSAIEASKSPPSKAIDVFEPITPPADSGSSSSNVVVDCTDLDAYLESEGRGSIARLMIVADSRKRGSCI